MHCPVESLTLCVSFGVVQGGSAFSYAINLAELLYHLGLEAATLIRVQTSWTTIGDEPVFQKGSGSCIGSPIFGGDGNGEPGEHVHQYQDVLISPRRLFQYSVIHCEDLQWSSDIGARHGSLMMGKHIFGKSTSSALPDPVPYILFHSWQ